MLHISPCCTLDMHIIVVISYVIVTVAAVKSEFPMSGFKVFFFLKNNLTRA